MKKLLTTLVIFITLFFMSTSSSYAFDFKKLLAPLFRNIIAPKYEVSSTSRQTSTSYSDNSVGLAKRVIPYSVDNEMKLQYISDYVTGGKSNLKDISKCPGKDKSVDLLQLSIYVLKNYQVPLEKAKIDEWLETNKNTILQSDNNCFQIIFDNFYNTPQGSDPERASSLQGNQVIRQPIADKAQINDDNTQTIFTDNSSKNLDVLHRNMIPDRYIGTGKSATEIKKLFEGFLVPEKEQK